MHVPSIFSEKDFDSIIGFITANPLATMVAQTNDGIEACHIPLFWHDDGSQHGKLYGHFARKNPIYQNALQSASWLIIFQDTGHYISPNWYPTKAKTHKEVPTWNYQSIHMQSSIEMIEDTEQLKWILEKMTSSQEVISDTPWSLSDAPADYIDAMCRAIVGFELSIESVKAQFKLSQGKVTENIAGVISGLNELNSERATTMAKNIANINYKSY